jgi:D-beta-D-heptose 7-phosphate kinase/D-beta-D-heptose 1-phosphate adenosyltransferase
MHRVAGGEERMPIDKIVPLEQAYRLVDELKRRGQRVVFTNGCFDLLHAGHTRCLEEARKLGDVLIVAINSDRSARALKGPDRPQQPEMVRAEVLAALAAVDYVTIFDDESVLGVVSRMLPNVLVKGGHYTLDQVVGHAEVEAAGGRVVRIPVVEGCSTTTLIQAARKTVAKSA